MKAIIEKGNIERKIFPGSESLRDCKYVNIYMGSGSFGGLFDCYGFMHRPYKAIGTLNDYYEKMCNTALLHQNHFSKGNYGLDYHIPIMRFGFSGKLPDNPSDYLQNLNIYDGYLETKMECDTFSYSTTSRFNPFDRDVLYVKYSFKRTGDEICPDLSFLFFDEIYACYDSVFKGHVEYIESDEKHACLKVYAGTGYSTVYIDLYGFSSGTLDCDEENICLKFDKETDSGTIAISVDKPSKYVEEYEEHCVKNWHRRWGDSYIDFTDKKIQALWCRSMYYLFCTYSKDVVCPAPPIGWTGNLWNFHFPQDLSYILPALLRLGHIDIAMGKVEFYASRLKEVKRNTKRIYNVDGAMWPWEFPISEKFDLFPDEKFPNWFQFEIHNAAYPARMAFETGLHSGDTKWIKEIALPIVFESSLFFKNISSKTAAGKWDLFVKPSMSQDEHGTPNEKNYLCALYSATYCMKTILRLVGHLEFNGEEIPANIKDECQYFSQILEDGYNFADLYNERYGIYFTSEEKNIEGEIGYLKHPVQLNPLFALALEDGSEHIKNAYNIRSSLCDKAWPGHICGWTLAAFWVSSSHMGKGEALLEELSKMPGDFMDENSYQFYESSILHWMQYYTTIHGLFLQAVNDIIVSDFWGEDRIGYGVPKSLKGTRYKNLRTKFGKSYSGTI